MTIGTEQALSIVNRERKMEKDICSDTCLQVELGKVLERIRKVDASVEKIGDWDGSKKADLILDLG